MEWVILIEIGLKFLKECLDKEDEQSVFNRLRKGGPLVALQIRRAARQAGLRGPAFREYVDRAMDELQSADDATLRAFLQEARDA